MFDILFGWSKASKCKRVIKGARCRLKLLKNKRHAIVRQSRDDVAELIKSGNQETAVKRVEQLIKDERSAAAYELLDDFCEFILTQLSYIRRHKDCPNDINEAASSLIYASARCGDLPELCAVRKLFGERYGQKFAATAVELLPGNLVNNQLKESLSEKSVLDDMKYKVVDEIARDYCLQPELLAIEYYPDWQQEQVNEIKGYKVEEAGAQINDTIAGSEMHASEVVEIQRDVICIDSSIKNFLSKSSDSCSLQESNISGTSALVSTVQKYHPCMSFPLQENMEKVQNFTKPHSFTNFGLRDTGEMVACVNDTEEAQFIVSKEGSFLDQRLLKFREETQCGYDYQSDLDEDESESGKSSTRSSKKSKKVRNKRSRRSTSLEKQRIMDIGCMEYYQKPSRHKTCPHYRLKHQKHFVQAFPQTGYAQKRLKQHSSSEMERNGCSLDHPCYFCVCDDDKHCLEDLPVKPNRGTEAIQIQQKPFWNEEPNKGMEMVSIPQRVVPVYNVFTYPDRKNESAEAYSRAVTMPPERQKNFRDKMVRTYSCPSQYPNHVHPKLPDYDDIAAKFTALKRERLENEEVE